MDYPDFSSIFPSSLKNFSCILNPNSGYSPDCIGIKQNSSSSSGTSSGTGGPLCASAAGKTICSIGKVQCTYDPTKSPPLVCKDQYCTYGYNNGTQITNASFKPPLISVPDTKTCLQQPPTGFYDPANTAPPPPPAGLPTITNSFTFNKWALPIIIPSVLTADDTVSGGVSPDKDVSVYWIQPPYVPAEPYSDMYPDPDPTHRGQTFVWDGLYKAMSKCIELDGSVYPPSNNLCTDAANTTPAKCVNPKLAAPNKRPKCYAVATQSDYVGNKTTDTSSYNVNYFLVEQPNSSPLTSLDEFNRSLTTKTGKPLVQGTKIDANYLQCQSQFYTWIKNTPSDTPYNTSTCVTVTCPNGPIVCPPSSPSATPCTPCSPVTCPIGSPTPNFNINSCPGPIYSNHIKAPQLDVTANLKIPPSFYKSDPNWQSKLPASEYKEEPDTSTPTTTYIIGGVVAAIILVGLYYTIGPGAENDNVIIPLKPVKLAKKIGKKVGGYFYYDY